MTVGEIVEAVDVGQSTVSHHLKVLAEVGFVQATPKGTARLYRFNRSCLEAFPSAAELVMGRLPRTQGVQYVAIIQPKETRSRARTVTDQPRPAPDPAARTEPGRLRIELLRPADWPAVAAIYAEGIATGNATFETAVPSWEHWDFSHLPEHRLIASTGRRQPDHGRSDSTRPGGDGEVVAWAALAPVSDRCAYAGVAENSIYVAARARGLGVGRRLLTELVERAERAGIWTVQTGIFPENSASLALHQRCGFRVLGVRERIGQLQGRWRDVVMLERRSAIAGR
jgi:L-amino acid N-acyltransferase YncA